MQDRKHVDPAPRPEVKRGRIAGIDPRTGEDDDTDERLHDQKRPILGVRQDLAKGTSNATLEVIDFVDAVSKRDPKASLDNLRQVVKSLCSICRTFIRGTFVLKKRQGWGISTGLRSYHESMSSLRDSVHAGCYLCKDINRCTSKFFTKLKMDNTDRYTIKCDIVVHDLSRAKGEIVLQFFLFDNEGNIVNTEFDYGEGSRSKIDAFLWAQFLLADDLDYALGPEYFTGNPSRGFKLCYHLS